MVAGVVAPPYALEQPSRWLIARFSQPWNVLSWCVVNGGFQRTKTVAWLYLRDNEIATVTDTADWIRAAMHAEGLSDAVSFMTSRRAHTWVETSAREGDCQTWAIGTIGLSNALRVGDPAGKSSCGTINLLVCVNTPLTTEAALEALCIATEGKTLAMLESGMPSVASQAPATGTGTDYLAVAWPVTGSPTPYSGKHTAAGAAIGRAAFATVAEGIARWQEENGARL
ncbi:MAG: adenosylcobinamide amidohydrolase [Bryobacteraceae bacterium]|nr:adenosylcobinamide amidohydrolase [Bryobacteraceae bacterium]